MGLQTWGESELGGVHQQFSAVEWMYKGIEDNGQKQLGLRGLGVVLPPAPLLKILITALGHISCRTSSMKAQNHLRCPQWQRRR